MTWGRLLFYCVLQPFIVSFCFFFFCKRNAVPFTATQVEAIRAGMQPGLTMVGFIFLSSLLDAKTTIEVYTLLLCCNAITLKSANQDAKQIHASGDWRGKMRLAFLLLCGLAENVAWELLASQQVLQYAVVIIWSLFTLAVRRYVVFQRNKENAGLRKIVLCSLWIILVHQRGLYV